MLAELAALALTCAPNISPVTLQAIITHESRTNQYAIGVNDKANLLSKQPTNLEQAIDIANGLIDKGVDFDAGLGQINVRNWAWLGLDAATVFDPCTNLRAAQTVLTECYSRAIKKFSEEQKALRASLSCYNTGNFQNGITNGYVDKVVAQAINKTVVPAIVTTDTTSSSAATKTKSEQQPKGTPDGFSSNLVADGFSTQEQTPSF